MAAPQRNSRPSFRKRSKDGRRWSISPTSKRRARPMSLSKASRTMLRTAALRAAHQLLDNPPIFKDPVVVHLVPEAFLDEVAASLGEDSDGLRTLLALRSRFAEDLLTRAAARNIS